LQFYLSIHEFLPLKIEYHHSEHQIITYSFFMLQKKASGAGKGGDKGGGAKGGGEKGGKKGVFSCNMVQYIY
jgi:hypothetical protein